MTITYRPIGSIHTPFTTLDGMPIQSSGAADVKGTVILDPQYEAGLKDLEGFSHLILIYHFHISKGFRLTVTPFLDSVERGLFATRAPRRPNPIGLSIVRLTGIHGPVLEVRDVDMLDGTPLLDIKPYVPDFDAYPDSRAGWLDERRSERTEADSRFHESE